MPVKYGLRRVPVRTPTFKGKSVRFRTFATVRNATPSTVETPNLVQSRRCYFNAPAGAPFTVPTDAEVSFNGTTWISSTWDAVAAKAALEVGATLYVRFTAPTSSTGTTGDVQILGPVYIRNGYLVCKDGVNEAVYATVWDAEDLLVAVVRTTSTGMIIGRFGETLDFTNLFLSPPPDDTDHIITDTFARADTLPGSIGVSSSGYTWSLRGAGGENQATVTNIQDGLWVSEPGDIAYAVFESAAQITRMKATISFLPGDGLTHHANFAAATTPTGSGTTLATLLHLVVTPSLCWLAVSIEGSALATILMVPLDLLTNGTQYDVSMSLSGDTAVISIGDLCWTVSDSRIADRNTDRFGFFEHYYQSTDALSILRVHSMSVSTIDSIVPYTMEEAPYIVSCTSGKVFIPNMGGPNGDELVVNGDFQSDTDGWIAENGCSIAVVGGELRMTFGATANPYVHATLDGLSAGVKTRLEITMRRGTCASGVVCNIAGIGSSVISTTSASSVTLFVDFIPIYVTGTIQLYIDGSTSAGETAYFDNISVKTFIQEIVTPVESKIISAITGAQVFVPTLCDDWSLSKMGTFDGSMPALTPIPAGVEVSTDDGVTYYDVLGPSSGTPAGAKYWRCRFLSSSSYETEVAKTPKLGGVNLVASWAPYTEVGYEFETLTTSGSVITSAINSAGSAYCKSNALGLEIGKSYQIRINLTLRSGVLPYIIVGTNTSAAGTDFELVQLAAGINGLTLLHSTAAEDFLWIAVSSGASNFSATVMVNEMIDYLFTVTTMAEPQVGFDHYTDADNYTEVENYVD